MNYRKQYFVLPNCYIAFNAKVASSALACSIVKKYYPDRMQKFIKEWNDTWSKYSQEFKDRLPESFQKEFNTDFENSKSFWQNVCLRDNAPNKKVLLAVREPLDRFISTCAYMEADVDSVLFALENKSKIILNENESLVHRNTHFLPQHIYMGENTKPYKFPEQLQQMCYDAELEYPLPKINEGKNKKPILNEEQIQKVEKIYENDFNLFNSLI
jgi:hypothetical protein